MEIKDKLLLKPEDFKPSFKDWSIDSIFNPAAIRLPNKKIMLYVRVAEKPDFKGSKLQFPRIVGGKVEMEKIHKEDVKRIADFVYLKDGTCRLVNISHFRRAILDKTGFFVEEIEQEPIFEGREDYEDYGVEDPRIVKIGNNYLMTYVSVSSKQGVSTSLAVSKDLKNWDRKGIIFVEQNKDVVLFPEKIKGRYAALHRPEGLFKIKTPSIWISYSKDLIYWGDNKSIINPRIHSWENERIGSGSPPIKTKKGWLLIYHGVKGLDENKVYTVGFALLDLKNPEKVIARTSEKAPFLKPGTKYEKKGFFNNIIFPTGIVQDLNKKDLLIYSGAADIYISVKKISIKDILNSMEYY